MRIKLNPVSETVRGKRVVLVDDSVVRGTTSARTVRLLREAGAKEVHFRLSSPPFLNPCYYGTDIPSREMLIAHKHTVEEMAEIIGVDSLGFISIESVKKIACGEGCHGFCTACFDNDYPTEQPAATDYSKYDRKISEAK